MWSAAQSYGVKRKSGNTVLPTREATAPTAQSQHLAGFPRGLGLARSTRSPFHGKATRVGPHGQEPSRGLGRAGLGSGGHAGFWSPGTCSHPAAREEAQAVTKLYTSPSCPRMLQAPSKYSRCIRSEHTAPAAPGLAKQEPRGSSPWPPAAPAVPSGVCFFVLGSPGGGPGKAQGDPGSWSPTSGDALTLGVRPSSQCPGRGGAARGPRPPQRARGKTVRGLGFGQSKACVSQRRPACPAAGTRGQWCSCDGLTPSVCGCAQM